MLTPDAEGPAGAFSTPRPDAEGAGCLQNGLFTLAALWALGVSFGFQAIAWAAGQVFLIQDQHMPGFSWLLVTWGQGIAVGVPAALGAVLTRNHRLRAAYKTWAFSAAFLWLFSFARLIPETRAELGLVAQGVLALAAVAVVLWLVRGRGYTSHLRISTALPAFALAPLVMVPWVAFGALGSPTDAVLGLLAGAAFGLFAGLLLDGILLTPLATNPGRDGRFAGFAAGVALAILASGFGFGGNQLMLMAALPPIGFAVAAMGRSREAGRAEAGARWLPIAVFISLATAAVLLFFDTEELTLLLDQGEGDIPTWAAIASAVSILLGWLAGLTASLWSRAPGGGSGRRFTLGSVGAWAALLLVYLGYGQPGMHGDGLFVILRDQADLSGAGAIADRTERARFVYSTLTGQAASSQAELRAELGRLGVGYRPYYLVNAVEVDGGPLVRLYLSTRPEVDRILDAPELRPLPEPPSKADGDRGAPLSPEWNITSIGADRVWREMGVTGRGIVVGQSDSGVDGTHPALRDGYRGRASGDGYNWLDTWNNTTSPSDIGGHGTHTLGSAVGRSGIGVAPEAEWFGCVNLARNLGNPARYLDCMQFMLAPYPQGADPFSNGDPARAAHVTNNSWGCPDLEGCDATSLLPAVRAMRAAGIFMAVSAGNSGPSCGSVSDPPAIYGEAFTVGAVDERGNVTGFSSRGPVTVDGSRRIKPDIVAPGNDVLSAFPSGTYQELPGTSMAGPHVAGVVALMWSAQPRLIGDVERTERILIETARPYQGSRTEGCFQGSSPNAAFGYGLLDAYAAVKAAMEMP